jgi:hypothetical protein
MDVLGRTAQIRFLPILGLVICILSVSPLNASTDERSGLLTLQLAANKSVFLAGGIIQFRLTVHNSTSQKLYLINAPPWGATKLEILSDTGNEIAPVAFPKPYRRGYPIRIAAPGTTFIWNYLDWDNHNAVTEWSRLDYWGYQLSRPGTYKVTAISAISGFQQNGVPFSASQDDKSNTVEITISK